MALLEHGLTVDGLSRAARRPRCGRPARSRRTDRASSRRKPVSCAQPLASRGLRTPRPSMRCGRTRPRRSISSAGTDNVAVATGTASGKSLCYQVPVAEAATDPVRPGTALLDLPDQGARARPAARARSSSNFPEWSLPRTTATARPRNERGCVATRTSCSRIPRCCTARCCRHHARWATFLMRLRYVVLDELHVFRGVFGTHTAHLLRRLRRVCASYAAAPSFIAASATIGEPAELGRRAVGRPGTADHRRRLAPRRAGRRAVQPAAVRRHTGVLALGDRGTARRR